MTKRNKILIACIVVILLFIWIHSMMNAELSSKESGFFVSIARPVLEPIFGKGKITDYIVRKLAHFFEFACLGTFSCALAGIKKKQLVFTWLLCMFAAVLDETIQLFSHGRASSVSDLWIDCLGAAFGMLLSYLITIAIQKRKEKKSEYFQE